MITVKFFGLISFETNVRQLKVRDGTVRQVLNEVKELYPGFTNQQIKRSVMFINKEQVNGNKRFSIVLKDGDELALINPAAGG